MLPPNGLNRWIEPALAALVVGFLIYSLWFLAVDYYLPQPFFFDPLDTHMDWVNTSLWARDRGTWDTWETIYPPLSFVFLRIFGVDRCYASDARFARECDWLGTTTLHAFFVLNAFLLARCYLKNDRSTAIWRSIALSAGLPMLFALDRGNLLIVCFTFYLLAFGPLLASTRLRWLSIGLAINFKPYLIASIFPQLLKRRWLWFEGALLASAAVYLLSFGILGIGTPKEIVSNVVRFTGSAQPIHLLDLWYAATFRPLIALLDGSAVPITSLLGSREVEVLGSLLPTLVRSVQVTIVLACLAAWLRPEAVPMYRLTNLGTSFALITAEAGGYTQALIIFLVFFEPWRGVGRKYAILVCYVLLIPADLVLSALDPLPKYSYLSGRLAFVEYGIAIGPFLRPALVLSLPFALACVTIREVWTDLRAQGWRQRRRYRADLRMFSQ